MKKLIYIHNNTEHTQYFANKEKLDLFIKHSTRINILKVEDYDPTLKKIVPNPNAK